MICYKSKFFSIQKYNIFMLKDEIQFSNGQDSFVIQLNSFQPKIKWIKNSNSDIISFELILDKKNSIFRFTPHIGKLLKEFMNGKICYQGINNHYKFAKYIQKRNYGSIVRMRCIENDELVICKIIKQGKEEYEQEFRNELQALQSLKHKNLPKLREYFIESHHNYLIYDLVEGASLNNYIQKNVLSKVQIYKIMKDLIQLVQYLHREGFSHQNIKLEKIFYCSMTDEITLVDFEQQRKISDQMSQRQIYSMSTLSSKDYTDLNVFSNNEIQTEKDYLDCGLVFFQLITQRILTNQEIISSSENRQIQQFINEIHNKHVSKFIMKLFNYSKLQSQEKQHFCQDIDELISSKRKNQIFF